MRATPPTLPARPVLRVAIRTTASARQTAAPATLLPPAPLNLEQPTPADCAAAVASRSPLAPHRCGGPTSRQVLRTVFQRSRSRGGECIFRDVAKAFLVLLPPL